MHARCTLVSHKSSPLLSCKFDVSAYKFRTIASLCLFAHLARAVQSVQSVMCCVTMDIFVGVSGPLTDHMSAELIQALRLLIFKLWDPPALSPRGSGRRHQAAVTTTQVVQHRAI